MACITRERPGVTTLGVVLIAVFAWEVLSGVVGNEAALLRVGALKTLHADPSDWWRIATYSFLHLNVLHLVMNLVALCWVGGIVERRVGTGRMLTVYAAGAAGAGVAGMALGSLLPTSGSAVGASGAIFGLLAAALIVTFGSVSAADRRVRRPLLVVLFAGITVSMLPGVSGAGHFGGLVGGAFATFALRKIPGSVE